MLAGAALVALLSVGREASAAAPAFVRRQHHTSCNENPSTSSFVSASAGNTWLVWTNAVCISGVADTTTVTDNQGNTYTKLLHIHAGLDQESLDCWGVNNAAQTSGVSITVTWNSSCTDSERSFLMMEYSSCSGFGASATNEGVGAGTASVGVTTTAAHSRLVAGFLLGGSCTFSSPSDTERFNYPGNGSCSVLGPIAEEDADVATAGSYTESYSVGACGWVAGGIELLAVGGNTATFTETATPTSTPTSTNTATITPTLTPPHPDGAWPYAEAWSVNNQQFFWEMWRSGTPLPISGSFALAIPDPLPVQIVATPGTNTYTATTCPTSTQTVTPTQTETPAVVRVATVGIVPIGTVGIVPVLVYNPSPTNTATLNGTATYTATSSASATATATETVSPSFTPQVVRPDGTAYPIATLGIVPVLVYNPSPTYTATMNGTATFTSTATSTATYTPTATATQTATTSPSFTPQFVHLDGTPAALFTPAAPFPMASVGPMPVTGPIQTQGQDWAGTPVVPRVDPNTGRMQIQDTDVRSLLEQILLQLKANPQPTTIPPSP